MTHSFLKRLFAACTLTTLLFAHHGCSQRPSQSEAGIKVAATIFPLYDITRNIIGDRAEAMVILPSGASPHTYELTPQQAKQLQGVRLVFKIGHGLDDWTEAIIDVWPSAEAVVVDTGIPLKSSGEPSGSEETLEHGHEHEGVNPHYWLSLGNGEIIARNIAREMTELDPAHAKDYAANAEEYAGKLMAVKGEIEGRMRGLPNKKIVTFHDAWLYFADEFGLEVVATFEPFPGKQPTPRYLAELQDAVRKNNIRALFSEPQLSAETIKPFVEDMGLKLYVLDPLGGVEGRQSYIDLMRYDASIIAEALSDG